MCSSERHCNSSELLAGQRDIVVQSFEGTAQEIESLIRSEHFNPFSSQEWSISNFPCSLTRDITSHHTVWGIWLHSLLRWKMIILPILTTSLIHISLKAVGRMYFLNLAVMFKTSSMHYLAGGTNNTNGVPRTESSLKEFPSFSLFTPVKTMSDFLLQSEMHPLACGGACSITHVRRQIPLSFKLTKTFIIRNFSYFPWENVVGNTLALPEDVRWVRLDALVSWSR